MVSPLCKLSAMERRVLLKMSQGLTSKQIARLWGLSVRTIEAHRAHILRKLGVTSWIDAIALLWRENNDDFFWYIRKSDSVVGNRDDDLSIARVNEECS
jgi:DNA-binding CsgD family transcriptional regulator